MTGTLYLIPNRIADTPLSTALTKEAIERAKTLSRFLVETAKPARALIGAIEGHRPFSEIEIVEIGHHPEREKIREWLHPLLAGQDTGLISDAGCPAVADPGADIVRACHELKIRVVPLVGASSILLTVMASGLCGQRFRFLGYLPIEKTQKTEALRNAYRASLNDETQLAIETPHRNERTFEDIIAALPESALLTVAQDITGANEWIQTATIADWKKRQVTLKKVPTVFAFKAAVEAR